MNLNSPDLNATETIDNITVPVPKSKDELRMLYSAFPASQSLSFQKSMGAAVNGSFSMAGLDFCLDLCLDHAEGVCAAALDADKAAGARGEVDVQLIVSAGMSIIPDNTRVPIGGKFSAVSTRSTSLVMLCATMSQWPDFYERSVQNPGCLLTRWSLLTCLRAGSVLLCDGLGSGAQHLVSKFGDTLLGGNVHTATAIDARAIPAPKRERHLVADNTPEAGMLGAVNISIYGDHWRKPVLDLFGAQRYKPRTQGYHHGSYPPPPPPPAEEIEENFLHGTPPSDWIFPPTPLPANTCVAALEKLCGASSSQTGRASDCTSCAGQHLIELVGAGCTDAFVVAFCSK
jgi:hypothetical protein